MPEPSATPATPANTRTSVQRNHAFIAPDSHVVADLPGWDDTPGVTLVTPQVGARFSLYLARMTQASRGSAPLTGAQRLIYVQSGRVTVNVDGDDHGLEADGYAWLPPHTAHGIASEGDAELIVFEKPYAMLPGVETPGAVFGVGADATGEPFMGDPATHLQTLLPVDPAFDMAVNLFSFEPGAHLPLVESHVMEHGLVLLSGAGVYRLDESWHPIYPGDTIWMGPYCPQWFVAMGKTKSTYLYYKDVHRDPLS